MSSLLDIERLNKDIILTFTSIPATTAADW